jgi:hypothetical protein
MSYEKIVNNISGDSLWVVGKLLRTDGGLVMFGSSEVRRGQRQKTRSYLLGSGLVFMHYKLVESYITVRDKEQGHLPICELPDILRYL